MVPSPAMPGSERTEVVDAHDRGSFDALTVVPEAGSGKGVLLLQEIFGVNDYVRDVAHRVAELGYVVLAPDLYWRIEPHIALGHSDDELQQAIALAQRFDFEPGLRDCGSALEHLRNLPEVEERVGVLGFCFGGTLAYHVAVRFSPDVVVSYYGSGVPDALELAEQITCPALFHFGGDDSYLPRERVEAARTTLEARPQTEFYVYEGAGHAFDNHLAARFHRPEAAAPAWDRTVDFLRRHL